MNAKRLTDGQALVLNYVREHPGCTSVEVRQGLGFDPANALGGLFSKRLVGRYGSMFGARSPWRWVPEAVREVSERGPVGAPPAPVQELRTPTTIRHSPPAKGLSFLSEADIDAIWERRPDLTREQIARAYRKLASSDA